LAKLLGIDTGGTYTDAVLFDEAAGVRAAAKDLTTKYDLTIGVRGALDQVLPALDEGETIGMVSLSTTLATNAIVEGHGGPVCLLLIGYDAKSLDKAGLREALKGDPAIFIAGGHNALGEEAAPLDLAAVEQAIVEQAPRVTAFAVAGFFGVRNPGHEIRVRDLLRARTGLPVTCAHELSSNLDAPRRALTALLNARLIPQLQHLILAVRRLLEERRIEAPLMVVKGDGSLVTDALALTSPVETILSGPAASVVGAQYLSGASDLVVSDIGGTTTDIAALKDGRPMLDREGARVGGWRTMVEAVRVHTFGLGGDSEVRIRPERWVRGTPLLIGPRRAIPLSLLCQTHPELLAVLRRQVDYSDPHDWDGRFAARLRPLDGAVLPRMEQKIWDGLAEGPRALEDLAPEPALMRPLGRLVDRGLAVFSGFTPSDAAHLLGRQSGWSDEAAELGACLLARRGAYQGAWPADHSSRDLAEMVFERLVVRSGRALVEALLAEEGEPLPGGEDSAASRIIERALAASDPEVSPPLGASFTLGRPLVAIGAPAACYYPEVAKRLAARLEVPEHAGVTNAVGAVAGGVFQAVRVVITQPEEGRYRAHLSEGIRDFARLDEARAAAEAEAEQRAREQAARAGAGEVKLGLSARETSAKTVTGERIFVEMEVTATAVGRPRLAAD
jgi:N-methylhydantoinase A/oxoprolinase/acetone carboxylase beta subunit